MLTLEKLSSETQYTVLSVKKAVVAASQGHGQGYQHCNCNGDCLTKKCKMSKNSATVQLTNPLLSITLGLQPIACRCIMTAWICQASQGLASYDIITHGGKKRGNRH